MLARGMKSLRSVAARALRGLPRESGAPQDQEEQDQFRARFFADVPVDLEELGWIQAHKLPESGPLPWLDRPGFETVIDDRLDDGSLSGEQARLCRQFADSGFLILEGFFDDAQIDRVWRAYEEAVTEARIEPAPEQKGADDPHPGHVMNAHLAVPEMYELFAAPELLNTLEMLLGREPVPFQTLMFPKGREQLEHSDTIHMTTYPIGYMAAAWIACEDIHPDSGPLMYYPGSHRLPHYFSNDVGIAVEEFHDHLYGVVAERYEPFIQRVVAEEKLDRQIFCPRKGDVLIWHENLIHGGSARNDLRHSRQSLVCHYFARGALCYHDLSGKIADRIDDWVKPPRPTAVV